MLNCFPLVENYPGFRRRPSVAWLAYSYKKAAFISYK